MKQTTERKQLKSTLDLQRTIKEQRDYMCYHTSYSNFLSKQLEIERHWAPRYWMSIIFLMITYWFGAYWANGVVSFYIGIIYVIITWIACNYIMKQKNLALQNNMDKFEDKIKQIKK